jgi:ATP-dependent Clp protease protease subunit
MRDELNGILVKCTGQDIETIIKDTDRDNFMSAQQAKDYGLIDEVIVSRAEKSQNGSGVEKKDKEDDK